MCGIAGVVSLSASRRLEPQDLERRLRFMGERLAHRGPDGRGEWLSPHGEAGFAHRRLAIIDLSESAAQPMASSSGIVITYNGEIYNHIELREELSAGYVFQTGSDTEVILAAYQRWGEACVDHLRGMFAFAIWDPARSVAFLARDRLGIKPFYYAIIDGCFYFASEIKALVPFLDRVELDRSSLSEYLCLQIPLTERTLVSGVSQLLPGHFIRLRDGDIRVQRYWTLDCTPRDVSRAEAVDTVSALLAESVSLHTRADVPVGAYVSGGIDSSAVAILANRNSDAPMHLFHGRFTGLPGYDESHYARQVGDIPGMVLHIADMNEDDFIGSISEVIHALDLPVAGPGAFPQYHVSKLAAQTRKVVLGGQGADEVFAGYTRYLIGAFEQALDAGIAPSGGALPPTIGLAEMLPSLPLLNGYQPLMREHFSRGLFAPLPDRFFSLIDRSAKMGHLINAEVYDKQHVAQTFHARFSSNQTLRQADHFSRMTHFELLGLLPALLHVEDRMSMAHGLESRVPFVDHKLVEWVFSVPEAVRLAGGRLKGLLLDAVDDVLPTAIRTRTDKMGFPVPLQVWLKGRTGEFVRDLLSSQAARHRDWVTPQGLVSVIGSESEFARAAWGFLSLELWARNVLDQASGLRYRP